MAACNKTCLLLLVQHSTAFVGRDPKPRWLHDRCAASMLCPHWGPPCGLRSSSCCWWAQRRNVLSTTAACTPGVPESVGAVYALDEVCAVVCELHSVSQPVLRKHSVCCQASCALVMCTAAYSVLGEMHGINKQPLFADKASAKLLAQQTVRRPLDY